MRIHTFFVLLVLAGSARGGPALSAMIDAVVAQPKGHRAFPALPSLSTQMRGNIGAQLTKSPALRAAYARLGSKHSSVWREGISALEKQKGVWPLLSALCHHSEDVQIYALRALRRLGDRQAVPFLLIYAEYMAGEEDGSENATIHDVVHQEIARTLSSLTGVEVKLKGQDERRLKEGIHLWRKWQLEQEVKAGPDRAFGERILPPPKPDNHP